MALNVGINGFGRIGRIIFRTCCQNPGLKVSAINDPAVDIEYICYLIKFDSTHGKFRGTIDRSENEINIDGHKIAIFREKLPANIPWQIADVQYVVEASGMFTNLEKASGHLTSEGVKRVLVTAPSVDVPMVVLGVNDQTLGAGHKVISCASSTLYCLAPIIKILEDNFGVSEGFITSIHAMTPSLKPLDGLCLKGKHWRDHRSIHQNIIPAATGACRALGRIIPSIRDKMAGLAFRVPIVNVSVLDITIRLKSNTTIECITQHIENAGNANMQNIIKVSKEQAVSSDFAGDTFSCVLDLDSSLQLSPEFFKLICWYENEYSYACRIIDSIFFLERQYQVEWKSKISYIRPTSKQSLMQTKDNLNKFTYHQACSYECHNNSKSLCSTSQDSGFKSSKHPSISRKPLPSRNFKKLSHLCKESKRNELFKIWNDEDEIVKEPMRQNRSSFFQSCVALTPQFNNAIKTRERLENVKREFSKMVIMTENLLKQSQHSKIKIGSPELSSDNVSDKTIEKVFYNKDTKYSYNNHQNNTFIQPDENNSKEKENTFSSDKNLYSTSLKANYNEETEDNNEKDNYIISTSIEDASKANKNRMSVNEAIDMANKAHNNEIENILEIENTMNNEKRSYSLNLNFESKLKYEHEDDKKRTSDEDYKENLDVFDCINVIEKITLADDNDTTQTGERVKEEHNCQNPIRGLNPFVTHNHSEINVEKDKCLQGKSSKQEQNTSYMETKRSETLSSGVISANDSKLSQSIDSNKLQTENKENQDKHRRNLQLRLEGVLKKLAIDSNVASERPSTCLSSINTITTASNRDIKQKQDIYDKLDSVSATDSENSFHMKERKSQVINITDLTNSLEDLDRLDKICRIMEISDELSDQLLSALNNNDSKELKNKKWSFKDFCERIKLDEFCNKIFNTNHCDSN